MAPSQRAEPITPDPRRSTRPPSGMATRRGSGVRRGFVLRIVEGAMIGRELAFEQEACIGRVEGNQVVLVEPGVSRRHARVYDSHGVFMAEDLGSANGTRLNGEKLAAPEVLRNGDHLTVGQTTFLFTTIEAAGADATRLLPLVNDGAAKLDASPSKATIPQPHRRRRTMLIIAATLIALGGGTWWYLRAFHGQGLVTLDQSDVTLPYSDDELFFRQVFGLGNYDNAHRDQVRISFRHIDGRVTLQFGAWGIDKIGELVILLNGRRVAEVPPTMNRWVYGIRVVLPAKLLHEHGENVLVFNNTRNPPGRDPWEVCFVQLLQEVLPEPDPQEAQRQFEIARKHWEDRHIEPGNAYAALVAFRRSRDLLEGLEHKPELYQEAVDYYNRVDRELTRRFQEGIFSAQRAVKIDNDPRAARSMLAMTLRYFGREDYRYRELKRYLEELIDEP